MSDSYEQHWEAEMDYIGDMLGLHQPDVNTSESENEPADGTDIDASEIAKGYVVEVDDSLIPEGDVDDMYQLMQVSGIKLAIPLTSVVHIYDDHVSTDDGIIEYDDDQYRVVDMKPMIDASAETGQIGNYVLIRDRGIAIACECVLDMVLIDETAVTWSHGNSKREWLAGTVSSQGVALIQLDKL